MKTGNPLGRHQPLSGRPARICPGVTSRIYLLLRTDQAKGFHHGAPFFALGAHVLLNAIA